MSKWAEFKSFVDTYSLRVHWKISGDNYRLFASDSDSLISDECVLDYESPTPDPSDQKDFEDNYKADGNPTNTDFDNTPYHRIKAASKGWTFQDRAMEFETSGLGSLYNKDISDSDYGDATLKFYNSSDVELVAGTQAELDSNCVKTVIAWTLPADLELIGGKMTALEKPTADVRVWCQGAPFYSGPVMISGINFRYIQHMEIDGRVVKRMSYAAPVAGNYTNTLTKVVRHPAGHKTKFLLEWEHYEG